jgi:uncharacterized protein DUF6894
MKSKASRHEPFRAGLVLSSANKVRPLPRYYFDMREGDKVLADEEGIELSTIEAAQREAARTVGDMARDGLRRHPGGAGDLMAIEVRDDSGPVLQVKFHWTVERHKRS